MMPPPMMTMRARSGNAAFMCFLIVASRGWGGQAVYVARLCPHFALQSRLPILPRVARKPPFARYHRVVLTEGGIHVPDSGPVFSEISRVRRQWTADQVRDYIAALPIWNEPVEIRQKFGGLTNRTYFAYVNGTPKYAIRVGFDQYRTRQTSVIQCTLAAYELGLGPRLVYAEPNLSVTDFVEGTGMRLEQM